MCVKDKQKKLFLFLFSYPFHCIDYSARQTTTAIAFRIPKRSRTKNQSQFSELFIPLISLFFNTNHTHSLYPYPKNFHFLGSRHKTSWFYGRWSCTLLIYYRIENNLLVLHTPFVHIPMFLTISPAKKEISFCFFTFFSHSDSVMYPHHNHNVRMPRQQPQNIPQKNSAASGLRKSIKKYYRTGKDLVW